MTMTTVRAPGAGDWLDVDTIDTTAPPAYTLTALTGQLRLPLELLTPGRPYTVRLHAQAVASGAAYVSLILEGAAGQLTSGAGPVWLEWTTTAARPLELDVRNVDTLTVHALTIEADMPAGRRWPGLELSLELMLPRPGAQLFTLDSSRLDRDALTYATPWPGTFVLGTSRLAEAYLYAPELVEWWSPVLGGAGGVATRRGVRTDGVVPVAEAGSLVADFPDGLDPRAAGIRRGTPVRLYHWPSRRPLFTGEVTRAVVTPGRPGRRPRYVTTLEAVDGVGLLADTPRYGAIVGPGLTEAWAARVVRLMGSAPELSWELVAAEVEHTPTMGNTVFEGSLAAHLDVAAASARGCWWCGADGVIRLSAGRPAGDPVALFTDAASTDPAAWAYVDALAGWDTAALISVVELTNLGATYAAPDWSAADTTVSVTNVTLAVTYGRRTGTGVINVAPGEAEAIATDLARGLTSTAQVTRVTLDGLPAMGRAAALELFAPAAARLRGELRDATITGIAHTITPRAWRTEVALQERITA